MAAGVRAIVALPDPVGEVLDGQTLANGLRMRRVRVPLGVIAVVYEARPNVTIDAAALCLKSGNAVVLRGSSSAAHSNAVLGMIAVQAVTAAGLPEGALAMLGGGDRSELAELATQTGVVDLIIPRGGEGLKTALKDIATVPVIYAASGNNHVYVDAGADLASALEIVVNAKCQRPGTCNAAETLLVHAGEAEAFLPMALGVLRDAGVILHGDSRARQAAPGVAMAAATEADWDTEYLALEMAVGVVDSVGDAISPHQPPRQRPFRGDRDAEPRGGDRLRARRRCRLRVRQRLHALHRRRGVRQGSRDRQFDPEASRPWADRTARTVHLQVPGPGRRARPRLTRPHARRATEPMA